MTQQTKDLTTAMVCVPAGKVATYGQIAEMMGYHGGARQVSWTLRTQTRKHQIPWHRMISSSGNISIKDESAYLQKSHLEDEGVIVVGKKVDLEVFRWRPTQEEIDRMKRLSLSME